MPSCLAPTGISSVITAAALEKAKVDSRRRKRIAWGIEGNNIEKTSIYFSIF
jgi:hypothetical protein